MKVGTKSLLFGAHQFVWHPLTVCLAWRKLYSRWPTWEELLCIVVHDWGYWGKDNMDGAVGKEHPWFGAQLATLMLGIEWGEFTLRHSRSMCKLEGLEPSKLCWADKVAITFEPEQFYLWRCRLAGELAEYRESFLDRVDRDMSDELWLWYIRNVELPKSLRGLSDPQHEPSASEPSSQHAT
jgi:hypothetical protein